MNLILLGTTGYHPSDTRHTTCVLLPECGVMFDAGTAVYRAARFLKTDELDIFLSHVHLDHVVGLTYLFDVTREHPLKRITVHGTEDKLRAVDDHLFAEAIFPKKPPCEFRVLKSEVELRDGGRLSHFPLEHPGGVVGFRVDWPDRSMAFVTDTTATPEVAYIENIRGVDLLVHECNFPDAMSQWATKVGHSHTTPVAQVARAAEVGRLVLMHVDPLADEPDPVDLPAAKAIFPATVLGRDLMEIAF